MTLDEIKASMKAANCAAENLANGSGCMCTAFGRGAGIGWTVSVICDGEELSWTIPPRDEDDGVGYARDFTCDTLRATIRDMLERLDRARADTLPVDPQSWQWPSSFFVDDDGIPLHDTPEGRSHTWIAEFCDPVPGPPYDLQAGDVIFFKGDSPSVPGRPISHSAIATGRGDEISHMWWTREIQNHMVSDGRMKPREDDPGPQLGGYTVTRDSLADIEKRFTIGAPVSPATSGGPSPEPVPVPTATPGPSPLPPGGYLTNKYDVWRVRDRGRANFDEFFGCP